MRAKEKKWNNKKYSNGLLTYTCLPASQKQEYEIGLAQVVTIWEKHIAPDGKAYILAKS